MSYTTTLKAILHSHSLLKTNKNILKIITCKISEQRKIDLDYIFAPTEREPYLIKTYGETLPRPTPYPYKKKKYGLMAKLFDKTMWRLDRNSKVILVEGNLASGKTAVAKQIAHDFDLKYLPSPTSDDIFVRTDGFDLRDLNHMLPRRIRHYDFKAFYSDSQPHKGMPGMTQIHMLSLRFRRYAEAMLHLLSTGQGVVIERSLHADIIFAHILHKYGFMSPEGLRYYWEFYRRLCLCFLSPHLTVYLDAPVKKTRERINARGNSYEINSKVLTDDFLETYNHFATNVFLPEISRSGEVLIVDASEDVNVEDVTEDVGNIDLETKDLDHYTKFDMWTFTSEHELSLYRHRAQDKKYLRQQAYIQPMHNAPDLIFSTDETVAYQQKILEHPRIKRPQGYEEDFVPAWKIMFLRP